MEAVVQMVHVAAVAVVAAAVAAAVVVAAAVDFAAVVDVVGFGTALVAFAAVFVVDEFAEVADAAVGGSSLGCALVIAVGPRGPGWALGAVEGLLGPGWAPQAEKARLEFGGGWAREPRAVGGTRCSDSASPRACRWRMQC